MGRPEGGRGEGDREVGDLPGRGVPDVQGHLHRPAQALPRPVRAGGARPGHDVPAHARRRVRACAGPRADPAAGAGRDRRELPGAEPLPARLGLRDLTGPGEVARHRPRVRSGGVIVITPVDSQFDQALLRQAFGCFPSGVTAFCGMVAGAPEGIAASSFTTVSLEPPLVSVCVANTSTTWPKLANLERFGLSVLAGEHGPIARSLSAKNGDRVAR